MHVRPVMSVEEVQREVLVLVGLGHVLDKINSAFWVIEYKDITYLISSCFTAQNVCVSGLGFGLLCSAQLL